MTCSMPHVFKTNVKRSYYSYPTRESLVVRCPFNLLELNSCDRLGRLQRAKNSTFSYIEVGWLCKNRRKVKDDMQEANLAECDQVRS